jgi:hypothetical protein
MFRLFTEPPHTSNFLQAVDVIAKQVHTAYDKRKKRFLIEKYGKEKWRDSELTQGDFLRIVLSIWPHWSSKEERQHAFRKVGITGGGLKPNFLNKRQVLYYSLVFQIILYILFIILSYYTNTCPCFGIPQFNFAIPERFIPRTEPAFDDSPEKTVRRGTIAYLQFKLDRAKDHVKYLKQTPMTPRELGVIADTQDTSTRKKKIIESRHGSFNLLGLMEKSKAVAITLAEAEQKSAEKANAKRVAEEKTQADLLSFKLCKRKCACLGNTCQWLHHTICPVEECGALISPLSTCQSLCCVKQRRESKKAAVTAQANKATADKEEYTKCVTAIADFGKCSCLALCVWRFHRLCVNPPCGSLLDKGMNCRKRACLMYCKSNGIALQKNNTPKTSSQSKKKPEPTIPRQKQVFAGHAKDNDVSDSEDPHSSDFELERIVSGPCKTGPNKGKYCIKWVGYDTDEVIYVC